MLQNKLRQLGEAFAELTDYCYHYFRPVKTTPCIIWAESGEADSFHADNHKTEQNITGTVDVFTKTEFDGLLDSVQTALDGLGAAWYLSSVQFEDDTQLIHYEWTWEIATEVEDDGEG